MSSTPKAHQLRARLLTKGITLRAFSKQHGFAPRTVQAALRGERPTGRKTLLVLTKINELTSTNRSAGARGSGETGRNAA